MRIKRRGLDVDPNKKAHHLEGAIIIIIILAIAVTTKGNVHSFNMVVSLSFLLAIGLLPITTYTADSAAQQSNHEWQAYGNTIVDHLGRLKRQLPEGGGGKCTASIVRYH